MKKLLSYIFISIVLFSGCEDDRVPSGIDAKVFWAECDTLPSFSEYDGKVYFVPYSRFNEVADSSWDSLKTQFNSAECTQGVLSLFLDPGNYFAEPDTFLNTLAPSLIIIEPDILLEEEIRFVKCD